MKLYETMHEIECLVKKLNIHQPIIMTYNAEREVLIDYNNLVSLPDRLCKGCGKQIDGDRHVTIVEGEYYCNFDCFCQHKKED